MWQTLRYGKIAALKPVEIMLSRRFLVPALILFALTLAAYWPALRGQLIWRDDATIQNNAELRTFQGLRDHWKISSALKTTPENHAAAAAPTDAPDTPVFGPAAFTALWLEYQMWGDGALGYRIVNVGLHFCAVMLLWRLLVEMGLGARGAIGSGAFIAAGLFAVHPINVESVAWISQQAQLLALAWALAGALYWKRWSAAEANRAVGGTAGRNVGHYILSLLFALLAFLSSPTALVLPVALLLIAWIPRGHISWRVLAGLLPSLIVGAAMAGWLIYSYVPAGVIPGLSTPDSMHRIAILGHAALFYLGKLLWPVGFSLFYPMWPLDTPVWPALAAIAAILVILWGLRRRITRGPFAAACFFLMALIPVSGFLNPNDLRFMFAADHWAYFAAVGIFAMAGMAMDALLRRKREVRLTATVLTGLAICGLTALSFGRAALFTNSEALYRDTLAKNPQAALPAANLADLLVQSQGPKAYPEAVKLYRTAIAEAPWLANAPRALASILQAQGDPREAQNVLQQGLLEYPNDVQANEELADMVVKSIGTAAYPHVIGYYERAFAGSPDQERLGQTLATIYLSQGRLAQVEDTLATCLTYHPRNASLHIQLANVLVLGGKYEAAGAQFDIATALDPGNAEALCNWGLMLLDAKQPREAEKRFRMALNVNPTNAKYHLHLGRALRAEDHAGSALNEFQAATDIDENLAAAFLEAGLTYNEMGNPSDAEINYRKALHLDEHLVDAEVALANLLINHADSDLPQLREAATLLQRAAADTHESDIMILVQYASNT